jgi:hypothetical protein
VGVAGIERSIDDARGVSAAGIGNGQVSLYARDPHPRSGFARVGPPRKGEGSAYTTFSLISPRPSIAPTMVWPRSTLPTPSGVPAKIASPALSSK